MKKLAIATTLGALMASTGVLGQGKLGPGKAEDLDSNSDGVVSYPEFEVRGTFLFDALDKDGNGELNVEEFLESGRPPPPPESAAITDVTGEERHRAARRANLQEQMYARLAEEFTRADRDADGFVSTAEFLDATFLQLDIDNDGSLSADELRGPERRNPRSRHDRARSRPDRGEDAL